MPPALSTYQAAANAIYEPQKQAEQTALQTTRDTTVNSLEAQKGQVNTDYQSAIDKLTQSVQDQSAQIAQLYSQRLGGNFSGLQGNDMGNMFSRANQTQGIIEMTRANKLSEITAGETNANISYAGGVAALTPKYQSLETQYAQSAYGSAVKDYNTNQLEQQKLAISASRAGAGSKPTQYDTQTAVRAHIASQLQGAVGRDGKVSNETWAAALNDFTTSGGTVRQFWQNYGQYVNGKYGSSYAGYTAR